MTPEMKVGSISAPVAEVRFSQSVTLNLGHYESTRIDVGVTLPSNPESVDLQKTFEECVRFVEKNLSEQMRQASEVLKKEN